MTGEGETSEILDVHYERKQQQTYQNGRGRDPLILVAATTAAATKSIISLATRVM